MGAVDVNPPNAQIHITNHASDWLWSVFSVMTVSMVGMLVWSHMRPRGTRFFHNVALIILFVSTLTYLALASDLGATPIQTEFRAQGTRQIFYVRYIQWFINFPLLLILMLFATGLAMTEILTTAFFAWIVVVCGLVGALIQSSYKWGFFTFGLVAMFYIWTVLLGHGPRTTFNAGPGMRTGYIRGSGVITLLLLLYPICWACSEGGNVISPTSEAVWYGVLDLLLGPFYLLYFIFSLRNVDYAAFGLQSWKYSDTYNGGGYGVGHGVGAAPATAAATGAGLGATSATHRAKAAEAGIPANEAVPTAATTSPAVGAPAATTAPATAEPTTGTVGGPNAANAV
ncbi:family A G protein-coupled receptor-like protein [Phanerochaete sordida]|uniref:Family A G protein-coupled receptor-like protein n=1 Tax=Phanerochaete sordida TaxID=48140 RepID=A0A9P3L937_9APHY|nr:family A G protein-coupled receptor-like protein [Phanerochaete sordida]